MERETRSSRRTTTYFQGEINLKLLEDLDIKYFEVSKETKETEIETIMKEFDKVLKSGK